MISLPSRPGYVGKLPLSSTSQKCGENNPSALRCCIRRAGPPRHGQGSGRKSQKMPPGLQESGHAADIIRAAAGRNRAKAGMLENPVKFASHRLGTEKISQDEGDMASKRKTLRRHDRERSNIQPDHLGPRFREGPGVVPEATAGHHHPSGDRIFSQPCDERGMRRALLPRRIASPVAFLPVNGAPSASQARPRIGTFAHVHESKRGGSSSVATRNPG